MTVPISPHHGTIAPVPQFGDPARHGRLAAAFPRIDELFADFRNRHRIPGVAYGVVIDDGLAHAGAVGLRDTETGAPVRVDSVFRIASLTKSVTAACVLSLRDDGALMLDDRVAAHVPELQQLIPPTSDSPEITIRHLLTMSAGFVEDDAWGDRQLAASHDDLGRWLSRGIPFNRAPGIHFEYSNYGYAILGRLAANVAGRPLWEVAEKRILRPLGMSSTTWSVERISEDRVVRGYRLVDDAWAREDPLPDGAFGSMGGLATTIEDWARYVAFHLSAWPPRDDAEKGPLRRSTLREMHQVWRAGATFMTPESEEERAAGHFLESEGYGYGLVGGTHKRHGRIVAHSGGLPGFGSHVQWLPDCGVAVLAFGNLTYAPMREAVWQAIDALAATNGLRPRIQPPSPALLAFQDALGRLYEQWDDQRAAALAADNLFLDEPADRRRRAIEQLRAERGSCQTLGELECLGALQARWRMRCERGDVKVTITLSPTLPPKLQTLQVSPAEETS